MVSICTSTFSKWRTLLIVCVMVISVQSSAQVNKIYAQKQLYSQFINNNYPEQLTSPEKKKRKSFAQFGYGLSFFAFPLFPITDFIDPDNFGEHSFGKPDIKEKNGSLYTCKGGFMDFSHIRVAADWTVYLAFQLLNEQKEMDLPSS